MGVWFWEKFPPRSVVLWRNPCCAWAGFDGPSLYPPLFWDPVTRVLMEGKHTYKKTNVDSVDKTDRIHIFVGEKITSSQGHFQMCNHYQPSKLPNSIAEIGWASEALRNRHWKRCHCYFLGWKISLENVALALLIKKKNVCEFINPQKTKMPGIYIFPYIFLVFPWSLQPDGVQILPKEARGALGHGPRERGIRSDMPRLSHVRRVGWNAGFLCRCGGDHKWQQLVGGFKYVFMFIPIWGRFPFWHFWLICFRWVEITNQLW